jgi:hypothetical protein
MRVKVFKHLSPKVVNRTVTLVGYDEVKGLNRDGWVVFNLALPAISRRKLKPDFSSRSSSSSSPRSMEYSRWIVQIVTRATWSSLLDLQVLDVVKLSVNLRPVSGVTNWSKSPCLSARLARIHQEQNPLSPGVLDEL